MSGNRGTQRRAPLRSQVRIIVLVDLAIGLLAYLVAWAIRGAIPLPFTQGTIPADRFFIVSHPWIGLALTQILLLYLFGLYDDLRSSRYRELLVFSLSASATQLLIMSSVIFFQGGASSGLAPELVFPRSVLLVFALVNTLGIALWRASILVRLKRHRLRVLIVGETLEATREMVREIDRSPWMGLKIVGLLVDEPAPEGVSNGKPILGSLDQLPAVIRRHEVEEVILASNSGWKDRVLDSVSRLQGESDVRIAIQPSVYEMVIGRLRHVNVHDTPLIPVRRHPNEPLQRFCKRSFDLITSVCLIVLLSPVMLLIGVLVRLSSPGFAFYFQDRIGLGGKRFSLIKFRTMYLDAEPLGREVLALRDDPRVTKIGRFLRRFRLDELPQLWNVLKGDMSFVGPRPERPGFTEQLQERVSGYSERYKIKPGITGLAQVRGFYHTSAENKLKYDLAYIYNYSFSLDLLLLLETVKVVLTRRGS